MLERAFADAGVASLMIEIAEESTRE